MVSVGPLIFFLLSNSTKNVENIALCFYELQNMRQLSLNCSWQLLTELQYFRGHFEAILLHAAEFKDVLRFCLFELSNCLEKVYSTSMDVETLQY